MSVTILLIDDDAVLVSMMRRKLMLAGFDVEAAPDGVLAMQLAQRIKPNLVILDMQFPGGGGQEVMERLKRFASTRHVPVVVLTAAEDSDLEARMIELGAAPYIQKPVELDNLVEEAHRLTRRKA